MSEPYLIRKSGMYYAHNSRGYTARALLAEVYTEEYAKSHASKHDEITAVPISEALTGVDEINDYLERIEAMKKWFESQS